MLTRIHRSVEDCCIEIRNRYDHYTYTLGDHRVSYEIVLLIEQMQLPGKIRCWPISSRWLPIHDEVKDPKKNA